MNLIILFLFTILYLSSSLKLNSFFNNWHCIGIKENIDFSKPYKINIGDLPLVLWRNKKTKQLITTINICRHMGSKLDNAAITSDGCLKCQYHGLEHNFEDKFGDTIEHEGKIFWSYNPIIPKPYSVPFFNNKNFVNSFLEIDMKCSLTDSAYNTMDLRHPEYVHSGLFGFGNSVPPTNIVQHKYNDKRVGLSFDYESNNNIRRLNMGSNYTNNFHMYIYPTFSWSKVTFDKDNHLIIGVNLLPLENKLTRWYITISNNYLTLPIQQEFLKLLASTILSQDFVQMKNQHKDDELKRLILFGHIFKDEDVIIWLRDMLNDYKYPDSKICAEFYREHMKKK
jgi:nitrite reductase/ring-hydroxylating ferredoxin subunit